MAKPKLPYERVKEAALALKARDPNAKISNRSVRAISGGDPAMVGEHLKQLKTERPELFTAERPSGVELPAGFLRVLQDEMRRREAEVSAALEGQLATVQENIEDLTRQVGELQEENSSFERQRDDLAAENERLQGQVQQQTSDLQRLQQQLDESQRAAEAARVALAQANLKAESQTEIANSLRNERDSLRTLNAQVSEKRVDAERELAHANGSLQELRKNLEKTIELHAAVKADRDEVQQTLDAERIERFAACQAEAKAAKERAMDLQQREQALRTELAQLRATAATATGTEKRGDDGGRDR